MSPPKLREGEGKRGYGHGRVCVCFWVVGRGIVRLTSGRPGVRVVGSARGRYKGEGRVKRGDERPPYRDRDSGQYANPGTGLD